MENLDVLYEILLLICKWWNIEHPGLFLMKIHPVERKLYIINGGTTALVFDESIKISLLTLRRMHWWLIPCANIVFQYSLSVINRLIACLHFRVQRDYKMPRNLGVGGTPEDCIQIWIIIATGQRNWLLECFIEMLRGERGLINQFWVFPHFILILKPWPKTSS